MPFRSPGPRYISTKAVKSSAELSGPPETSLNVLYLYDAFALSHPVTASNGVQGTPEMFTDYFLLLAHHRYRYYLMLLVSVKDSQNLAPPAVVSRKAVSQINILKCTGMWRL